MAKCCICKSARCLILYYENPIPEKGGGAGSYWCWSCATSEFREGDRVVMFAYERRGRSCRSLHNIGVPIIGTVEQQLDYVRQVGEWAQRQGRNAVQFYLYHWEERSTESFGFGMENSMEFLEENLKHLREWADKRIRPKAKVELPPQSTLDEFTIIQR